ncbi:MAG: helix-turn-helix transcriptional regulator [Planctomycetota bacterium]
MTTYCPAEHEPTTWSNSICLRLKYHEKKKNQLRNSTPENTFGLRVREIRENAKKRLTDVASHLEFSVTHQCDIELGRRNPYTFERIVSFVDFCGGNQEMIKDLEGLAAARQGFVRVDVDDKKTREVLVHLNQTIEEQGGALDPDVLDHIEQALINEIHSSGDQKT